LEEGKAAGGGGGFRSGWGFASAGLGHRDHCNGKVVGEGLALLGYLAG
jgi:hypothetical protein